MANHERRPITILLDRVQSHHEIGEIFRLCEAFRVQRLVICGVRFNIRSRKLEQAGKGSQHKIPWTVAGNAFEVVKAAKDYGVYVVVVGQAASGISIKELKPDFPVLLVLSSEHMRTDQQLLDWADTVAEISILPSRGILSAHCIATIALHKLSQLDQAR